MKRLMKVFSDGSAMWKEWGMTGLLRWSYVGEWAGSCSVGRLWKRWIDAMKDCLKKRGLDVRQGRRMLHDRSVWWGFVKGNA